MSPSCLITLFGLPESHPHVELLQNLFGLPESHLTMVSENLLINYAVSRLAKLLGKPSHSFLERLPCVLTRCHDLSHVFCIESPWTMINYCVCAPVNLLPNWFSTSTCEHDMVNLLFQIGLSQRVHILCHTGYPF